MTESKDASPSSNLRSAAADSVVDAIKRGRKRRLSRNDHTKSAVQIGLNTSVTPERLADPSKQVHTIPYHKRRRTSLIPMGDEDGEEDSNDEWEEHVDMDVEKVEAAVKSLRKKAEEAKQAASGSEKKGEKGGTEEARDPERQEVDKEAVENERKVRERRRAVARRKLVLRRHRVHILLSVAHLLRLDSAADDEDVRGFSLSITPEDTLLQRGCFDECLARLALWLSASFRVTTMTQLPFKRAEKKKPMSRLWSAAQRAISCARDYYGNIFDVTTMVAALIRAQGFRCRVVSALQPLSHVVPKGDEVTRKETGKVKVVNGKFDNNAISVLYSWVEVWSPDAKKWTPMDLFEGFASGDDSPEIIRTSMARIQTAGSNQTPGVEAKLANPESRTRRRSLRMLKKQNTDEPKTPQRKLHPSVFSHVVAVEDGFVKDVSRRYIRNWKEVESARAKGKVYEKVLELFHDETCVKAKDEVHRLEVEEFDALSSADALPTSMSALQRHPRFILERHVKKYETIYPRAPIVGYFKEEPIFPRSNVRLLHTKDRWIRRMRQVIDEAKPMKMVKSKNGSDDRVDLFGEWQTTELKIPECVNGVVPTSVHGNVDLWTPEHLPKGTVHVNLPYAKAAARQLGVDCAPAMTGFELRRGRSVPKLEGIVIAAENEDMIRDAARAAAKAAQERLQKKIEKEAKERDKKAKREAWAREEVRRRHGGGVSDGDKYKGQAEDGNGYEIEGKNVSGKKQKVGLSDGHEHKFGEAENVDGDIWVKSCTICGLDVSFEKL